MIESSDLLAYYEYWVNGETLSRWQLLRHKPSQPPVELHGHAPILRAQPIQLTLEAVATSKDLRLAVNASKLAPVYQILLHGSQATADVCDFSDVDILVVLDDLGTFSPEEHCQAISELQALLKTMFLYDCLMHHGFMFMLRSGFENYDEGFLPIDTLRNARVIHGPSSISARTAAPLQTKQRLQSAAESLARRLERRDHERNDYAFKSVLSGLLLMPSLLLASNGIFCYKRDSFSLGPQRFPQLDWAAIRLAEELRAFWKRTPVRFMQRIASNISHPNTIIRLTRSYATRTNVRLLLSDRSDAFIKSARGLLSSLGRL